MFLLSRPHRRQIQEFLARQRGRPFSYAETGATRMTTAPPGYTVDRNRIQLGQGEEAFLKAKRKLRGWRMFDMGWTELCDPDTPIQPGSTVAVVVSHYGFWSMNACRIVYVMDEPGLYGFAYGTLVEHAEIGEERFAVELDPRDGAVWYDIYAMSRPRLAASLAYPLARRLQKRFAADSKQAMRRAVEN